ncbi:MAG: hypothetical protein EB089_01680, partial [Acidimicrobiia bacterium]|nr:hypothetical protein [Acidimicrobiia bacterium]
LDDDAAREVVRGGGSATSLQMNCSGKHSGMLAASSPITSGIIAVINFCNS